MLDRQSTPFSWPAVVVLLSILLVQQSSLVSRSAEKDGRWHWFSALSLQNDWWILGGEADVFIRDGKITAEFCDETGFQRMSLKGSIEDHEIEGAVIRHGTDDGPRKLTGMLTTYEHGRSSILLHQDRAGGMVIGLTRD